MKDIDRLKKRSRARRTSWSAQAPLTCTVRPHWLLFLTVLVSQIAKPTFIDGESGQIEPASEFIPVSDYILSGTIPPWTTAASSAMLLCGTFMERRESSNTRDHHHVTGERASKKTSL